MALEVTIARGTPLPRPLAWALARRVERAARALGWDRADVTSLGMRVVRDAEMGRLHERHLGSSKPTDVLSFPGHPGDLLVNFDAVRRQAENASAAAWLEEAAQLCVHGLVHLLGHDHATPTQARRMLALERRAARAARLLAPERPYGACTGALRCAK